MKELFDYCVKVDWDESSIAKYASDLGLTYNELIEQALGYAEIYADIDVYEKIIEKLEKNIKSEDDIELSIFNPVLLSLYGVKSYKIWRNEEEKKIVLKKIYTMWEEDNNVKSITKKFGISNEDAFRLLKVYAISYLGMTEDKIELEFDIAEKHGKTATSKLVGIYEALIKAENMEDVATIIESSGYNTTYLRSHLHDYLIRYNRDNYDKYMSLVISKFRMYNENKRKQKTTKNRNEKEEAKKKYVNEMLPVANKLIKMFVDSSCPTLEVFFEKVKFKSNSGLTIYQIFDKCLKLVKDYNEDLYGEYEKKLANEKKKYYETHINELLMVVSLLKDGIDDNKIKRNFDIIDFFRVSTISLNDMLSIAKEAYSNKIISPKDYGVISRFVAINKKSEIENEKDIAVIYNETRTVNVVRNSDEGVSNKLETINNETKDRLINYLRDNNVPVNYVTYNAALTRYKMGYLLFEDFKSY